MIPLGNSTRRLRNVPVTTRTIIAVNAILSVLELVNDDAFICSRSGR